MAIYNTDIPSSNSITFPPPAPVNQDQRDIRSSMIAGSQYKHDENLTKWQQWAQKALHVSGDPFLILVFHDLNIDFLIKTARKEVSDITGAPSRAPEREQLIELLLLTYQNFRQIRRKNLRSLLLKFNNSIVTGLVNKMISNGNMYKQYYHDKFLVPQPIPLKMPRNVHLGGARALKGGNPFVE